MRQTIVISDEVYQELMKYIDKNYGQNRRVLSIVIEKAVKEFLEREGGK
jgi:predicted CopG family antitoxin